MVLILFSALIAIISMVQNYELVFNQYANQFLQNAWNSSEMGFQIQKFANLGNDPDNAFVIPYPHWVDTRLVGMNAGFSKKDYAIWTDDLENTLFQTGEKLFIIKPGDQIALDGIKFLYPDAEEEIYYSMTSGKDFLMIHVR